MSGCVKYSLVKTLLEVAKKWKDRNGDKYGVPILKNDAKWDAQVE
jgi:hypothetical protein